MLIFYIIKWAILYFLLIFLAHHLYLFFEKNLTTTKIKDFYNFPSSEYNKINSIISNKQSTSKDSETNPSSLYADIFNDSLNSTNIGIENFNINNNMDAHMKNELQDFLNNIK